MIARRFRPLLTEGKQNEKVLIVCGNGLGSSFIVEMNVKKILAEMNKEAEVAHTDLTSAKAKMPILFSARKTLQNILAVTLQRSLD